MSRLETLPTVNPLDFKLSSSPDCYAIIRDGKLPWSTNTLATQCMMTPLQGDYQTKIVPDETIFPSLPPLYHGHPEVHLRNGIMNASRQAAAHVPDAEKAFFVADLSQVYQQHLRWKACLPEVIPFYGKLAQPIFSADN